MGSHAVPSWQVSDKPTNRQSGHRIVFEPPIIWARVIKLESLDKNVGVITLELTSDDPGENEKRSIHNHAARRSTLREVEPIY